MHDIPGWTCSDTEELYRNFATGTHLQDLTVVEVGVAYGRSLAYLAERCSSHTAIWGVDVWTEHMGGDNLPADVFARMQAYGSAQDACVGELTRAGVMDRVQLLNCGSLPAAAMFADESVDLVFIDACHELEPCRADIKAWLPKVRPGGMLAGHDYSWNMFPGVVQAVCEAFGDRERTISGVVWKVRI